MNNYYGEWYVSTLEKHAALSHASVYNAAVWRDAKKLLFLWNLRQNKNDTIQKDNKYVS